jgi:hypothetical protein
LPQQIGGGKHILHNAEGNFAEGLFWRQAFERTNPEKVTADVGYMNGASGIGAALLHLHLANSGSFDVLRLPDDPFPAAM